MSHQKRKGQTEAGGTPKEHKVVVAITNGQDDATQTALSTTSHYSNEMEQDGTMNNNRNGSGRDGCLDIANMRMDNADHTPTNDAATNEDDKKPSSVCHVALPPPAESSLPDIVISWILHNDCNSNVQLATLSNVCRNWRKLSLDVVVLEAQSWIKDGIPPTIPRILKASRAKKEMTDRNHHHFREESYGASSVAVAAAISNNSTNSNNNTNNNNNNNNTAPSHHESSTSSPIRKLFLIDMARELIVRQRHHRHLSELGVRESIIHHLKTQPQVHNHHNHNYDNRNRQQQQQQLQQQQQQQWNSHARGNGSSSSTKDYMTNNIDGNFCLSWFAPSGIQIMSVPLEDDMVDDDDEEEEDEVDDTKSGMSSMNNNVVTCCHEWRGYRHAMEVLAPFGYSTEFVRNVLDAVSEPEPNSGNNISSKTDGLMNQSAAPDMSDMSPLPSFPPTPKPRTLTRSSSELSQTRLSKISSHIYNPTFAVRGATLARPEGFCLCLETDFPMYGNVDSSLLPLPYSFQGTQAWMNNPEGPHHPPLPPLAPIQTQISVKRTNLTKVLLPKMIMSTRRKNSLMHRFAETDSDGNHGQRHPSFHNPHTNSPQHFSWEKRQRSVQFLNSDRSQAVRLMTTPFQCGPIRAPVTMFVVAIATEDGCFVSGKNSRYEFGHLYPLCNRDMMYDTSPVCIATEKEKKKDDKIKWVPEGSSMRMELLADLAHGMDSQDGWQAARALNQNNQGIGGGGGYPSMRNENQCGNGDGFMSSDDDDSESSGNDRTLPCHCKFESKDPFVAGDLDIDDPSEEYIRRGRTGPGRWHCYVAVFDGKDSMVRVDGCDEPQMTAKHYGLATTDDEDDGYNNPEKAGQLVGSGILDGLSIGSDHQFDMSLCYGEIEGQGGEGAISELAVFKGRMELSDIEQMEKYLMKKHGLLSVQQQNDFIAKENSTRMKPIRIGSHWQEDEWKRQAQALIQQAPPWDLTGDPVPLRVAANHKSVSWHRVDEITGKVIPVSRIGSKLSNGSSDW